MNMTDEEFKEYIREKRKVFDVRAVQTCACGHSRSSHHDHRDSCFEKDCPCQGFFEKEVA